MYIFIHLYIHSLIHSDRYGYPCLCLFVVIGMSIQMYIYIVIKGPLTSMFVMALVATMASDSRDVAEQSPFDPFFDM